MQTRVGVPVELEADPSAPDPQPANLICFSHLRWDFVFQRPQHLMTRFAREVKVIYWEEPIEIGGKRNRISCRSARREDAANTDRVPHLLGGMPEEAREATLRRMLDALVASRTDRWSLVLHADDAALLATSGCRPSPSTMRWTSSAKFKFAPVKLLALEQELLDRADVVFTGGSSL